MNKKNKDNLIQIAHTIRGISIDAIENANSGHPGLPLGCAEIAAYLYGYRMQYCPTNPQWQNRDRFVLSAGHGSMLLYSTLHLAGFDVSLDDCKQFRQYQSPTAGHPEYRELPGIEMTTGPLGQGLAASVGMALGNKIIQDRFQLPDAIWNGKVVVLAGDGCMMEGVSSEAGSFAGHMKLNRLIVFYDSNDICLDGPTSECFTEDTAKRFESQGWKTIEIDGHNFDDIHHAYELASNEKEKPTLIVAKTTIGKFSPNRAGTSEAHGKALGAEETRLTKESFDWPQTPFFIPSDVKDHFNSHKQQLMDAEKSWKNSFDKWKDHDATRASLWDQYVNKQLPDQFNEKLSNVHIPPNKATRSSSNAVIQFVHETCPFVQGGSADLSCSDNTSIKNTGCIQPDDCSAYNIKYGAREFGMSAIATGLSLHGMFTPFCGTFLMFSDYMRNSIRLAALMNIPVIYQFTHDSVMLGEDGPTHQPIEHLAALRAMPNLTVIRPADSNEVKGAWIAAMQSESPVALILSRQNAEDCTFTSVDSVGNGGYIVKHETANKPVDVCLIATGTELQLAYEVAIELEKHDQNIRVVSMPSFECFDNQSTDYKKNILGGAIQKYVSIEAQSSFGWHKYIGREGIAISIDEFGLSAPEKDIRSHFGFTKEKIIEKIGLHIHSR